MLPLHPLFSYIDISNGVFTKLDNLWWLMILRKKRNDTWSSTYFFPILMEVTASLLRSAALLYNTAFFKRWNGILHTLHFFKKTYMFKCLKQQTTSQVWNHHMLSPFHCSLDIFSRCRSLFLSRAAVGGRVGNHAVSCRHSLYYGTRTDRRLNAAPQRSSGYERMLWLGDSAVIVGRLIVLGTLINCMLPGEFWGWRFRMPLI